MANNSRKRNQAKPQVEQLNQRCLLASGIAFNPASGIVAITGTPQADRVIVQSQGHGAGERIRVQLTTPGVGTQVRFFSAAQVKDIQFQGLGGNDVFRNDTAEKSTAWGGAGNDVFIGGRGRDTFDGGIG